MTEISFGDNHHMLGHSVMYDEHNVLISYRIKGSEDYKLTCIDLRDGSNKDYDMRYGKIYPNGVINNIAYLTKINPHDGLAYLFDFNLDTMLSTFNIHIPNMYEMDVDCYGNIAETENGPVLLVRVDNMTSDLVIIPSGEVILRILEKITYSLVSSNSVYYGNEHITYISDFSGRTRVIEFDKLDPTFGNHKVVYANQFTEEIWVNHQRVVCGDVYMTCYQKYRREFKGKRDLLSKNARLYRMEN